MEKNRKINNQWGGVEGGGGRIFGTRKYGKGIKRMSVTAVLLLCVTMIIGEWCGRYQFALCKYFSRIYV